MNLWRKFYEIWQKLLWNSYKIARCAITHAVCCSTAHAVCYKYACCVLHHTCCVLWHRMLCVVQLHMLRTVQLHMLCVIRLRCQTYTHPYITYIMLMSQCICNYYSFLLLYLIHASTVFLLLLLISDLTPSSLRLLCSFTEVVMRSTAFSHSGPQIL